MHAPKPFPAISSDSPPGALRFRLQSDFDMSVDDLWAFHMRPEALSLLSPPLSGFRVLDRGDGVADGSVLRAEVGVWPLKSSWVALHCGVEPGRSFTDIALESPFPYWIHVHDFESLGDQRSRLTDTVWFLPPRFMGRFLGRILIKPFLRLMFAWRHRATGREAKRIVGREAAVGNQAKACGHAMSGGLS